MSDLLAEMNDAYESGISAQCYKQCLQRYD
jgi:hypothetical protein